MKIGERINLARLRAGMSADELSAKIGKNRATIYRYESDEIDIPLSMINTIAAALNVSPAYLSGWTDIPDAFSPDEVREVIERQAKESQAPDVPKSENGIFAGLFVDGLPPEKQQRAIELLKVAFPKNEHDEIV